MRGALEPWLAQDVEDACVLTRVGGLGRNSDDARSGRVGCLSRSEVDVKALPAAVPGRELYSGSVVWVVWRESMGGFSSLAGSNESRLGNVGCRFIEACPAHPSCLARRAFSFFNAFSTFVLTILSML